MSQKPESEVEWEESPNDECSWCRRTRVELADNEELFVEVATSVEVQDYICSTCRGKGYGLD